MVVKLSSMVTTLTAMLTQFAACEPSRVARMIPTGPRIEAVTDPPPGTEAERGRRKPILVVDDPIHDFGEVWVGPILKHEFKIKNIGGELAYVKVIRPGAWSGTPNVWIEPGQTVGLTFSLPTRKLRRNFTHGITLILMPAPKSSTCLRCGANYEDEVHLSRCGPVCPRFGYSSFARVISN